MGLLTNNLSPREISPDTSPHCFVKFWIPAFAGMTKEGAGMTAGMTNEDAGMTFCREGDAS
tara:strand:+ start:7222 stop:7404 length:183 start_codon:yes stop_codon:yes gene_type:complete